MLILVVEDDLTNQTITRIFLEKLGYQSHIAENGHQALKLINDNQYNLILMDCQMPIMDGFEATKKIRSLNDNPNQNIPIIALTANIISGIRRECEKAGMNDLLNKPILIKNMQQLLERWLG